MKCIECNKETDNPKFCDRKCSAAYNCRDGRHWRDKKNSRNPIKKCLSCNKIILKGKTCSHTCASYINAEIKIKNNTAGIDLIRNYLRRTREYKCEICFISSWNNLNITLQVDHKNGDSCNNTEENLRLLCPNCHSQTPTFGIKNKGNGRHIRRQR